ncbi:hypothetical protein ACJJIF_02865 [Microbulbifer sp. SSSA002]|uniref:hypothetical protein n=1 Tax=Microbulbifer sp. SSSA002 TaxID=3243376 RepID=UPI0040396FEC
MVEQYIYSGRPSKVQDAAGVSGVIIKSFDGTFLFRVYNEDKSSHIDYRLNHDDLAVTIQADELASFYSYGEDHALDYSPKVLGLKKPVE